ncbi:threonylcarbamoyl-AMP synthase [Candidatus Bipolaricaulota bacterium]|nr:threonylcarbamoyl-AMP synthase [Candidatus Bipolaricaulota bacterium]
MMRFDDPQILAAVRDALAGGGVVVFPSDTVYGIGGNAWDDRAVAKARRLKQRSADLPFALHLPTVDQIEPFARLEPRHRRWIESLLPGPYTLLLPAGNAPACSVKKGNVGIRVPDHPFFSQVMAWVGIPLFGTSVNRSGLPPLVGLDEMIERFPDVDLFVEDTGDRHGIGGRDRRRGHVSAVLDLSCDPPVALRGELPPAML